MRLQAVTNQPSSRGSWPELEQIALGQKVLVAAFCARDRSADAATKVRLNAFLLRCIGDLMAVQENEVMA
jgi:hypothetical protein